MKHYNEIFKINQYGSDNNFNLHNHTIYSDGEHSVRDIISESKDKIITHLSITDHDTIGAYTNGNAMIMGEGFGVNMIPGVEATFKMEKNIGIQPHMLMYFSELLLKDKQFLKDFNDSIGRARSKEFVESRIKKINEEFSIGLKISDFDSKLGPSSYIGLTSRHFRDVLFEEYKFGEDIIAEMIGPNSPAYMAPGTEMIDILYLKNKYDMVSVMAHPFTKYTTPDQMMEVDKLVKGFIENNSIDGLEKIHPDTGTDLANMIGNYKVPLFTGGSDTHYKEGGKAPLINQNVSDIINHDFNRLNWKGDLALMVGRMNPPHIGHIRVIKNALKENSQVILLLGSADVINEKNIFTHAEKIFFFETYFSDEIRSGKLIIDRIDDVGNNQLWVKNAGKTISKHIPGFNKKLNIYGGDFKDDMAIAAFKECQKELNIDNVDYVEIPRDNFTMFDNGEKYDISATNLRKALKDNDFDLARKFIPEQIADLEITKWKEKNNLLKTKNIFIVSPPKGNRNYNSSKGIADSITEAFDGKYIVEKPTDADMIVVLGGDGSLIWAIQQYGDLGIPFYPLAAGTANAIPAKYEQAYQLFSENIETIKLNLLDSEIYDDSGKKLDTIVGFNDIYLKAQNGEMGHLMVEADHYPRRACEGDGLVISTPVGSTAYNKNAGGSVLDLGNNGLIVTDLVSKLHSSDVISNDSTINITSIRGNFDIIGNSRTTYENFSMKIKKSDKFVEVILPQKEEFRQNRYKG